MLTTQQHAQSRRHGDLRTAVDRALQGMAGETLQRRSVLRAYDPSRQLQRGWSLVHDEAGRLVRSIGDLGVGVRVRTSFIDGSTSSIVDEVTPIEPSIPGDDDAG
jgi:exonuclease VII large subunit